MSYSKGFERGYDQGFDKGFTTVIDKIEYVISYSSAIRKKQLLMVIKELENAKNDLRQYPVCEFSKPWQGTCKNINILDNGQCANHQAKCSLCENLATRACGFASSLVCGRDLCDECNCDHYD